MVHLESPDVFFRELAQMFQLCQQRGAGTVYITVKEVKEGKGAVPGDSVGYLARAKISNKKARKISASVPFAEIAPFRAQLEVMKASVDRVMIAGGASKRGLKPPRQQKRGGGAGGATSAANGTHRR